MSLAFLVMAAGRRVRAQVEARLRGEGIALRHLSALGHVRANPGISGSELARRAGVTVQSMQATLDGLERLGAIERDGGGQGRALRLDVTTRGAELIALGASAFADADTALAATLDPQARRALTTALLASLGDPPSTSAT